MPHMISDLPLSIPGELDCSLKSSNDVFLNLGSTFNLQLTKIESPRLYDLS